MSSRERFTAFFNGHFAFLCVCSMTAGIVAGTRLEVLASAIPWAMATLMFSCGLGLRLQDLRSLREKPWILPVTLFLVHVAIPVGWMTASTFLGLPAEAVMGFTILAMLPISASCVVWIGVNRGNMTLGMALVLIDTLCAPFILPYMLAHLFGADVHLDPFRMLRNLFWMLFFPTLMALVCNQASRGALHRVAGKQFAYLGKMAILGILCVNGGVVSPFFRDIDVLFLHLFGMTVLFSLLLFLTTFLIGRMLFSATEDVIAFMLTSVRTTATGMVIAMACFPPMAALPLAFNMLIQQSMGSWAGKTAAGYLERKRAVHAVHARA